MIPSTFIPNKLGARKKHFLNAKSSENYYVNLVFYKIGFFDSSTPHRVHNSTVVVFQNFFSLDYMIRDQYLIDFIGNKKIL